MVFTYLSLYNRSYSVCSQKRHYPDDCMDRNVTRSPGANGTETHADESGGMSISQSMKFKNDGNLAKNK